MTISPAQCRAARGLLGWSQDDLVEATQGRVVRRSVTRFENESTSPHPDTVTAIRAALESAGVIFIAENGDGPGVRLRKDTDTDSAP